MEIRATAGYAIGVSAALVLLAGCSSGTSSVPSTGLGTQSINTHKAAAASTKVNHTSFAARIARGVANPAAIHDFNEIDALPGGTTLIYVSDAANNVVDAFTTAGKEVASVSGFEEPQGIAVDSKGNVLVANTEESEVLVYSADLKKVIATLQDPGEYPAGVAVSSTGEVGVTNIISTEDEAGNIAFYKSDAKNASKPSSTATSSDGDEYFFGAFDSKGGFYNDGFNSSFVFELAYTAKGSKTAKPITVSGATIEFPGGVEVSKKGDVEVDDQEGPIIYTLTTKGKATGKTDLSGASDPVSWAWASSAETDLWAADASNEAAEEWKFPAGGSIVKSISISGAEPIGIGLGAK